MEKRYLTVKEAATKYSISQSALYQTIKTDPFFPSYNIGRKKKIIVDDFKLVSWMGNKSKSTNIMTAEDIYRRYHERK